MTGLRERVQRASEFTYRLSPGERQFRQHILESIEDCERAYRRLEEKYNGMIPIFKTGPEIEALALWRLGVRAGVMRQTEVPSWVRKEVRR